MSVSSNREWIKAFIELYRSEPCLWKTESEEFRDYSKKDAAYEKLINKYREVEPEADRETVSSKLESLRSDYRKELEKVIATRSELTGIETYEPDLWYFPQMRFLDDQERADREGCPPAGSSSSLRSVDTTDTTTDDVSPTENNVLDFEHEDDLYDIYGKMVAAKLKAMSDEQRTLAEKLIDEVWNEAKRGRLTKLHTLVDTTDDQMPNCSGHHSPPKNTSIGSILFHSMTPQQQGTGSSSEEKEEGS